MAWHELKTWPPYFEATLRGDCVRLKEWDPESHSYSGRELSRRIGYILEGAFGLPEDKVILDLIKI